MCGLGSFLTRENHSRESEEGSVAWWICERNGGRCLLAWVVVYLQILEYKSLEFMTIILDFIPETISLFYKREERHSLICVFNR